MEIYLCAARGARGKTGGANVSVENLRALRGLRATQEFFESREGREGGEGEKGGKVFAVNRFVGFARHRKFFARCREFRAGAGGACHVSGVHAYFAGILN